MVEYRFIGRALPRPDAADKATGRARYIHDLDRPGMLHGAIKFSEHPHARIVDIDTSRAERLPGVRAVITAKNTPELRVGFLQDNRALKGDKVRSLRDEVAAVAAVDADIAAEAVELIRVEYEPLPAVFDPEQALEPGAPLVHEHDARGRPRSSNRLDLRYHHHSGDLDAARGRCRHIVEGVYSTQRMQHACLGTSGCVAEFDARGNLTMWAKTQIPFLAQRDFNRALEALGLGSRNSRVIVPALGGSFGSGLDTNPYEYIAILLAWRSGRPVKILYSREQEFACLAPRQGARVRIRQGCDDGGRLLLREIDVLQDNGAYASWGATYPSVMMLPATSLYRVPNVRFDAELVYTNNIYCQAMRGYGNPEVTWAIESSLDELAAELGMEPVELRLRNGNRPGETTPMGLKVTTCGLEECLRQVGERLPRPDRRQQGSKRRGVGLAALIHVGGGGRIYRSDGSGIMLKPDDFGNINVYCGGVEMGQGMHAALVGMVAEELGVEPERVVVNPTDTGTCPWDVGTHASRGAFMAGKAVGRAAAELRRQIFAALGPLYPRLVEKKAAELQKKDPGYRRADFDVAAAARDGEFEMAGGCVFARGAPDDPALRLELDRVLRALHFRTGGTMPVGCAFYDPPTELPDWSRGRGNFSENYAFGCQGAEVEVDTATGEIKILRLVAAHDVGRVLNRLTLEGQTYGALAQGLGYALYEEIRTEQGRVLNPDFRDYKIPTAGEMDFPVELLFIETDDPAGPFGAKGVGEAGMIPTAPAIANAVYDAVGIRLHHLPLTPEKVLEALDARRRS